MCAMRRWRTHSPDLRKAIAPEPCASNQSDLERRIQVGAAFPSPVDAPPAGQTTMRDKSGIPWRRIKRRITAIGRAPVGCARASSRSATGVVQARNAGRPSSAVTGLSCLCALGCALALSGCAPGSEARSDPARANAAATENSVSQMCRPERALLKPQPAPDCRFAWSDLKTVDPDQWARLKVESERKCYQRAEKIARERLRLLQASVTCEAATTR
jgi:hypothetical protein